MFWLSLLIFFHKCQYQNSNSCSKSRMKAGVVNLLNTEEAIQDRRIVRMIVEASHSIQSTLPVSTASQVCCDVM